MDSLEVSVTDPEESIEGTDAPEADSENVHTGIAAFRMTWLLVSAM
jgi:hypothetical protein